MKRLIVVLALLATWISAPPAEARGGKLIKVTTRNLYVGADLPAVIAAPPEKFLEAAAMALTDAALNDFTIRAEAAAHEFAITRPQAIGLQEVFNFTFDIGFGPQNGPPPFLNMLDVLMAALANAGLDYQVVAKVRNIDLAVPGVPVPGLGTATVGVTDHDVILVRGDVAHTASPVAFPGCTKPSLDGCNFAFVAPLPPQLGGSVERGFVGVDLRVGRRDYRFVNTHLETMMPDPTDPASSIVQAAQAAELIQQLAATPLHGRQLITVGDFNSSPDDPVQQFGDLTVVPPYVQMVLAGHRDVWNRNVLRRLNPDGFTCCQDADLNNDFSLNDERIDLIFVKSRRFISADLVIGDRPFSSVRPKWASDHAGVFGVLLFLR